MYRDYDPPDLLDRLIFNRPEDDSADLAATRDPHARPCIHCKTSTDVEPEPGRPVLCASCEAENDKQFEGRR